MRAVQQFGFVLAAITVFCCAFCALADEPRQPRTGVNSSEDAARNQLVARAKSLNAEASMLVGQRRFDEALKCLEDALAATRELYPVGRYPQGHMEIAKSFAALGNAANAGGNAKRAVDWFEKSRDCYVQLYPVEKFPDGHFDIASITTSLGLARQTAGDLDGAERDLNEAAQMSRRLFPLNKYPKGDPSIVTALHFLGQLLHARGRYTRAVECYREAAEICDRLYPPETHPHGHLQLAQSLSRLGLALQLAGDVYGAIPVFERSLRVCREVFPIESFPQGHPDIAWTLWGLGGAYSARREFGEAMQCYEKALAIFEQLFPDQNNSQAQEVIASVVMMMGITANGSGDYDSARKFYERVLRIYGRIYPEKTYPNGHPSIVAAMRAIAATYMAQRDFAGGIPWAERTCKMLEKLNDAQQIADGDREIASALIHLATDLIETRDVARADEVLLEAERRLGRVAAKKSAIDAVDPYVTPNLTLLGSLFFARKNFQHAADATLAAARIQQAQIDEFYALASTAESLNLQSKLDRTRNGLISVWPHTGRGLDDLYAVVWARDGAVGRASFGRLRALIGGAQPEAIPLLDAYANAQKQLARLAMVPADSDAKRHGAKLTKMREWSDQKESLERQLAAIAPDLRRQQTTSRRTHAELQILLPNDSVFIHFVRYGLVEPTTGAERKMAMPSYAAFVLAPRQKVAMLPLGPAEPIESAVREWRRAIATDTTTDAPATLRRLVWEPIEEKFPPLVKAVYLTPDGVLSAVPWSALPGKAAKSVLLEQYSLSLVPYGPFLLDQLTIRKDAESADDVLLTVGGVAYDDQPALPANSGRLAALRDDVASDGLRVTWPELPGTLEELDPLLAFADERPEVALSGREASTERVLAELPKARWAVFATHGFFADPKFRSSLQLDESIFEKHDFLVTDERTTPVGRNPLLLSGLVLAGANLPRPQDDLGIPVGDGGILSAETISSLPLEKLDLAVLSACDTGLGEVAGGEGAFGLQRAFHQAGAANVVASLWKIDDRATAALMRLFYYKLFRGHKPALVALREAQLAIYLHPEEIGQLASTRAPQFGKMVKLVDGGKSAAPSRRTATRLWAGFVLSGIGR